MVGRFAVRLARTFLGCQPALKCLRSNAVARP